MKPQLVLALLVCLVASCYSSTLYSIITEFSWNSEQTRIYTVKLDLNTGAVTNVTANFVFAGGSAMVDGISAFDQKNGKYYFATDGATAFIYGTDVKNKRVLPTLDIGADYIIELKYDEDNERLYTIFATKTGAVLAAIGPQTFEPVLDVPSTFNQNYVMKGAVDGKTNTFYIAGKIGTAPVASYGLATINLANGQIVKNVPINNSTCQVFPEYMWLDQASGLIFAGAESFANNDLYYWFLKINPTGACTKTPLKVSPGIVTDWSFDPSTNQLWFAEATNGGAFLNSYNVKTGAQNTPVLVAGGNVPESIEISTRF